MYETQTQEVILERMLDRVGDEFDKRQSSLIWDTHSSTAIELQNLYIELDTMITNSYGDTAAREYLTLLAKDRGITVEPATNAILKGVFVPASIDVTGERFNIDKMNYVVTEKIADGEYQVKCETSGEIGNRYLGNMIPMNYIDGLESATLTEVLIPGEDEEDTETLRKRYLNSFNDIAFGGNRTDYISKVKAINGVGDVKVTRAWNSDLRPADMIPSTKVKSWYESIITGLDEDVSAWLQTIYMAAVEKKLTVGGTVLVTLVNSSDFGECGATIVNSVQTALDPEENAGEGYGVAPIGHVVNVQSALPVKISITTTLMYESGYSWENSKSSVEAAVAAYLQELRKEWADHNNLIVRIARIESEILNVKGIADIAGTTLNGETGNLTLGEYEIPILGEVTA